MDEQVTVPLDALRELIEYTDGARAQRDTEFVVTDAEQEASDKEFADLVGALGVPGLIDEERRWAGFDPDAPHKPRTNGTLNCERCGRIVADRLHDV